MNFKDKWKSQQTSIARNEIAFFRFLANLLVSELKGVQYFEVHGNPGHVEFQSSLWPSSPPIIKEIGDLLIITYSHKTGVAKYTFHQNKFCKSSGIQRTNPTFKFKADIYQYDLLAFRPDILSKGSIKFPPKILSGTSYFSVGSYGVFFEGHDHLIDYVYSTARWLSPQSYCKQCNLILNTLQQGFSINGEEAICFVGITDFIVGLTTMQIGAPVQDHVVGGFLNKLIQIAAEKNGLEPPVIDLPMFHEDYPIDLGREGYRLMLINVDEAQPNK